MTTGIVALGVILMGDPVVPSDVWAGFAPVTQYGPGDTIELSDFDYCRLVACGVLVNPAEKIEPLGVGNNTFQIVAA